MHSSTKTYFKTELDLHIWTKNKLGQGALFTVIEVSIPDNFCHHHRAHLHFLKLKDPYFHMCYSIPSNFRGALDDSI